MNMKIDVGRLTYTTEYNTRPSHPLPIGIYIRIGIYNSAKINLFGQLRRKRGIDWRFDNANIEPNIEPSVNFPRIHLRGEGYIETYPYGEFVKRNDKRPTLQILRKYERNFLLVVTFHGKIEDLTRREEKINFVKNIYEEIKHKPSEFPQGHLRGYYISEIKIPEELYQTTKRLRILNHEFSCAKPFQYVECDYPNGNYSVLIRCLEEEMLHVVSPHHLDEPYSLWLSTGCYYFFTHPEPVQDGKD